MVDCCKLPPVFHMVIEPSFSKPFGNNTFYQNWVEQTHIYLKNRCPHEHEILQGIRDTFESLRNVKVSCLHSVYLVTIATPQRRGVMGEIARFKPRIPIIHIATKLTIFKMTL